MKFILIGRNAVALQLSALPRCMGMYWIVRCGFAIDPLPKDLHILGRFYGELPLGA